MIRNREVIPFQDPILNLMHGEQFEEQLRIDAQLLNFMRREYNVENRGFVLLGRQTLYNKILNKMLVDWKCVYKAPEDDDCNLNK